MEIPNLVRANVQVARQHWWRREWLAPSTGEVQTRAEFSSFPCLYRRRAEPSLSSPVPARLSEKSQAGL